MGQLHIFFFPMMAHGHMIPILDIAKLFASQGVKSTIITTPLNANLFTKSVERSRNAGLDIGIRTVKFPAVEAGLPEGCESGDQLPSADYIPNFFRATAMLQEPLEQLLAECHPNCLVADMFFPWATEAAAKFNIPRLIFHGTSTFPVCVGEIIRQYKPHNSVSSDDELFVVPNLPHQIKFTRKQLSQHDRQETETDDTDTGFISMVKQVRASERTSYGVIVNSFYELEPDYADHYTKILGRRAWHIGPVSLCNKKTEDKVQRGKESTIDEHECLKWLDSKKPNSVIYVCFGSVAQFSASQLYEIAMGLESSEQQFIWVVRIGKTEEGTEEWLPEGFEERVQERGLIIRGWAPQVLILDHEAVGGFVTHCGWNSTLEGICAGVPMVTWPVFAEQFYNEKFLTEILRIGVGVGALRWSSNMTAADVTVEGEAVAKAVKRIMVGEEAEEMRTRVKNLKDTAKKAVEEGGSSYSNLNALIQELSSN